MVLGEGLLAPDLIRRRIPVAPTRRSFLTMAALASTVPTLAACSGSRSTSGTAASGGVASQASDTSGDRSNADLVIWADQKKADSLKEIAKTWGNQQGISVAVQTVANDDLQPNFVTANQAGNGPDVVVGAHDWIGNLVQNSAIRPVVLSPEAESNYSDIALKAVTYDGQIYATPYAVECLGLFVNKALTSVTQPASIEEMIEAGKAAGTELVLSQAIDEKGDAYNMEPIYTAGGGYLFGKNQDGSYNPEDLGIGKEGSIKAAEKIRQLGQQGVLRKSVTAANHISLFTGGKAPYLISGPWALADIKKAGMDYQLTRIPGFKDIKDSQARPFVGVDCFYVASNGKNKAFAETFVADAAKDMTFAAAMFPSNELPPAQKDLADKLKTEQPDMVTFADLSAKAEPMPAIPAMSSVWEPFGRAQANIVAGADPASTMTGVGKTIQASINGS